MLARYSLLSRPASFFTLRTLVSSSGDKKWDIASALAIERMPTLSPPLNALEKMMKDAMEKIEVAKSLRSDHEMQLFREMKSEKTKGKKKLDDESMDTVVLTALDVEEINNRIFNEYIEFEKNNPCQIVTDQKSLERHLDRSLMFVCKQKVSQTCMWRLPEQNLQEGENLREAAERCLNFFDPETSTITILGNCPFSVLTYKYPKSIVKEKNVLGKKVFFFKAQIVSGYLQPLKDNEIEDFAWLTRDECSLKFRNSYWKPVRQGLLIEEENPNTLTRVIDFVKNRSKVKQEAEN